VKKKAAIALGAAVIVTGSLALTIQGSFAGTTKNPDRNAALAQRAGLARAGAESLIKAEPQRFHVSPGDDFRDGGLVVQDDLQYVSYTRTYRDLPVVGGDFVVVTDSAGTVLSSTVAQRKTLELSTAPRITAEEATLTAAKGFNQVAEAAPPVLSVVARGTGVLAYEVAIRGTVPAKGGERLSAAHVFVNAKTGSVIPDAGWDEVVDAEGTGFYYGKVTLPTQDGNGKLTMIDTTHPGVQCGDGGNKAFTKTGTTWGNGSGTDFETACVDGMFAVGKETEMLKAWLGRDGIDGKGHGFPINMGLAQVNAFWDGRSGTFGHSQDNKRQLTVIDVVGHEFGHAIFQFTPGGSGGGGNEVGGLNESTGDIFGALTEAFANDKNDAPDFEVGELADLVGKGPIRSMSDPSKLGDPNCFSNKIPSTEVHAAAGPQNHWFYLLSQGSKPATGPASPTCNNKEVTGLGIEKAGKIYMGTLNRKTSGWSHAAARAASVEAAIQLFPGSNVECSTVKAAWDAVSVPAKAKEPACAAKAPAPSSSPTDQPTTSPTAVPPATPSSQPAPSSPGTSPGGQPAPQPQTPTSSAEPSASYPSGG